MEEEIAKEPQDCSLREGNGLSDMSPTNYFTSVSVFESFISAECNFASSGKQFWELKIGLEYMRHAVT